MKRVLLVSVLAASTVVTWLLFGATVDAARRPKIFGIEYVRLYVSDMEKSRAFYKDVLRLGTIVCHGLPACFWINTGQRIELEKVPSPAPKNWIAEIGFRTSDAPALRRYLLAHHVAAGNIVKDEFGIAHFSVRDPEGNNIVFVNVPPPMEDLPGTRNEISDRLLHAGFVVKDMAAENHFYRDVLGFRLYWHGGFKDNDIDWYEIQVPDGNNWIEYMLNIDPKADHKELGVQNHFSLGVKDANAAAAQLRQNGLLTFDGPEVGRDGKNSLDAYDPDATRVEVMEFKPAQKPCCHPYEAAHPIP
jgi:catechol 2,3-dioxygenase-like lactoylglutathione lyase family enzyme